MTSRLANTIFTAALAIAAGASWSPAKTARPVAPIPVDYPKNHENLPQLTGSYAQLHVQWHLNEQVHDVVSVFADPNVPSRVYVATNDALLRSTDGGKTFAPLAQATVEKIGVVSSIAFEPDAPNRIIVATHGHGLWSSRDGGDTLQVLATKSTGLAGDDVKNVYFSPDDKNYRTILAIHGVDATGISRSNDGGKTWQILFPEQHILQAFWIGAARQLMLECSPEKDPDSRSLYYLASLNESWQKLLDDVYITGVAKPQGIHDGTIFIATADKGLFRIAREGGIVRNVGPADPIEWSSFGMTWGPTADSQLMYGYDAKNRGMVLFTTTDLLGNDTEDATTQSTEPREVPIRTQSDGLFTGPLVLDGAQIRANANGTTFYAAVNRTLYQTVPLAEPLSVTEVTITPQAVLIDTDKIDAAQSSLADSLSDFTASHSVAVAAKDLQTQLDASSREFAAQWFRVTAKVVYDKSNPPTSVTVDLSRVGLGVAAPLYDDGQHDDGAAGDGVYSAAFSLDFSRLRSQGHDWRFSWPGPVQLTVSAITRDQKLAGCVGSLSLFSREKSVPFLGMAIMSKVNGSIVVGSLRAPKTKAPIKQISIKAPGNWAASIGSRQKVDTTNQQVLSFWIRSSQVTDSEVSVQLRDSPTYSRSTLTKPVNLLADGFIPGGKLTPTKVRVNIPLSRIMQDAVDFQPSLVGALVISGTANQPVDILIGDMEFRPDSGAPADDDSEETP